MRVPSCSARAVAVQIAFTYLFGMTVAVGPVFGQGRSDTQPGTPTSTAPGATRDRPSRTTPSSAGSSRAFDSGIASPVTATSGTSPAASANSVAYFGSWLDDASVVEPGKIWVSLATGYWRGAGNRQIDAPVASVVAGINSRMHVGGSLSFYHFRDADGLSENGFGSNSIYAKFLLLDPSKTAIGVAVTPLVDVFPSGGEQVGWALPVSVESRRDNLRLYGSVGYFSRGSIFGTMGADLPITSRVSLNGSLGQSYGHEGARQTTVGIGTFVTMTSTTGIFIGVGHTGMPSQTGPGGLSFAGGLSFFVSDPKTP